MRRLFVLIFLCSFISISAQEKKSTKAGDTELLKRVIRSTEGTFTGYIRNVEGLEAPEVTETTTTEEFKPFMANEVNTSTESTNTLN